MSDSEELDKKKLLKDYVKKCIETKQEIKTMSGKFGFIPHSGEDELFEQCYKEGDPIRKHFKERFFLSKTYCHLVEVFDNGKVYFVMPENRKDKKKPKEKVRWRYFKNLRENRVKICPSGLPVYEVYGLVFGCYTFIGKEEQDLLEKNVYKTHGKIATHHVKNYKEPEVVNGVPLFEEDAGNLIIMSKSVHDNLLYNIPGTDNSFEEYPTDDSNNQEEKPLTYDEQLKKYIPEGKEGFTRISERSATKGKNKGKEGRIFLTDQEPEEVSKFMEHAGAEYPKCIVTFKGSKDKNDLYNESIYQYIPLIAYAVNRGAEKNNIVLPNGLTITAYKHVKEDITGRDIKITQPIDI